MRKKKQVVIDSSVIVKWLSSFNEEHLEQADQILTDAQLGKIEMISCELAKYEVANALLKGRSLDLPQAKSSLATLYNLPISFISEDRESAQTSYEIGKQLNISYYDATFLSLAKKLGGILITDNLKHQGKTTDVKVIPLAKYSIKVIK